MERKKSSSLILGAITGFDQALINPENRHLLDVADDPTNPDDESRGLIRRLASAVADKEVRQRMDVEDEIVSEARDRCEGELMVIDEEERRQKDLAIGRAAEAVAREAEAVASAVEERRQKEAALAEIAELKRQLGNPLRTRSLITFTKLGT